MSYDRFKSFSFLNIIFYIINSFFILINFILHNIQKYFVIEIFYVLINFKNFVHQIIDKNLIKVIPTKMKPFQGWRYYLEDDIPQDLNVNNNEDEEFPEQIRSELIKLGLY